MATAIYQTPPGQKTAAQSVSVTPATDGDLLRLRALAPRISFGILLSAIGDSTIIAAPAAGQRIAITSIRIQNGSTTALTALIKHGASGTNPLRVRCPTDGSGLSEVYENGNEIRLPAATALVVNLSAAASVGVSVRYYLENASTGVPI